jgi:hypothetical protein
LQDNWKEIMTQQQEDISLKEKVVLKKGAMRVKIMM